VVRTVVPDQHESFPEINGMKFREAPPDAQPVLDQHGEAGFELRLAAHGEARRRSLEFQGGSFAAAIHDNPGIFMVSGSPSAGGGDPAGREFGADASPKFV
jgi:hypothetical protein